MEGLGNSFISESSTYFRCSQTSQRRVPKSWRLGGRSAAALGKLAWARRESHLSYSCRVCGQDLQRERLRQLLYSYFLILFEFDNSSVQGNGGEGALLVINGFFSLKLGF